MLKIIWAIALFLISTSLSIADVSKKASILTAKVSLEQYKKELNLEDIYIAFVQPSLISPMSYFGHTFLVFKKYNSWGFSKTFSFTAVIPENISNKDLLFDGAIGKLTGRFVIGNFHEFKDAYLKKEQRGINLHKLNLTNHEKEILILKSYEVYNNVADYHFFEQNCSTELIEYLSTIRPSLLKKLDELIIKEPASLVNLLQSEQLINEIDIFYAPSIARGFHDYLQLDASSRRLVNKHLERSIPDKSFVEEKNDVKGSLINISSLLFNLFNSPPALYKQFQNLNYTSRGEEIPSLKNNLAYTSPSRFSFGLKQIDDKTLGEISFMPSHFERFEERFSFVNESTLKTFYTSINFDANKVEVEQFDFFELAAYNKSFSKMIIPTWRIYTGYNDIYSNNNHTLMSEIGYGVSFGNKDLLVSFMPQIRVDLTKKTVTGQFNTLISYWYGANNFSYNFVSNNKSRKEVDNIHKLNLNIPLQHNLSVTFTSNILQSEYEVKINKRFSL